MTDGESGLKGGEKGAEGGDPNGGGMMDDVRAANAGVVEKRVDDEEGGGDPMSGSSRVLYDEREDEDEE